MAVEYLLQAAAQLVGDAEQPLVEPGLFEDTAWPSAAAEPSGFPAAFRSGRRSRLGLFVRVRLIHDVGAARDGTHRQAAADDLPVRREVGLDVEVRLRAAEPIAETRHHLVEDQQHAVARSDLAYLLEIARLGRDDALDRFDDHRRELVRVRGNQLLERVGIVERRDQGKVGHCRGDAGRIGRRCGILSADLGRGAVLRIVVRAVVRAFELDDADFPVNARARRIAWKVDSDPDVVKRMRSAQRMYGVTFRASSTARTLR